MAGRLADQVREERICATTKFAKAGIHAIDPGASEQRLWKKGKKSKIGFGFPRKIMDAFVSRDKWLIRHCDALLVLTGDTPSDGTWREMCYAEKIGIPVIMIGPKRLRGEIVGWSNIEVSHIVTDLDEAVRLIKRRWVKEFEEQNKYFEIAIKNAKSALHRKRKTKKFKSKKYKKINVKLQVPRKRK
jgi:hypothetical protein